MALINTDFPKGHEAHGKTLRLDRLARAVGLEFPPWELVKASNERVERQIEGHCKTGGVPIKVFDWEDKDLVEEYFRRNPDKVPASLRDKVELISEVMTQSAPAPEPQKAPASVEDIPKVSMGRGRGRARKKA